MIVTAPKKIQERLRVVNRCSREVDIFTMKRLSLLTIANGICDVSGPTFAKRVSQERCYAPFTAMISLEQPVCRGKARIKPKQVARLGEDSALGIITLIHNAALRLQVF